MTDSILDDPRVQRLIKIQDAVRAACPGEDVEIVDADAVYVNFAVWTAVCIEPYEDSHDSVNIVVTEWDQSGGVHAEHVLASYTLEEYAPLIVKAFLEQNARHEAEIDRHLEEGGAFEDAPRRLVDPNSFTHMQQVDNDGNPIGKPIPLPRKDS